MLLSSFGIGAILIGDAGLRIRNDRIAGVTGLVERAGLLATMQAEALSVPLWNLDDDLLASGANALARDPDFSSVEIVKQGGKVIRQVVASIDGTNTMDVQVVRPIQYVDHGQTRLLGQLRLSLQTRRLEAALGNEEWQRGLWLLGLLTAVLVTLAAAIRQLGRPLELLVTALSRLATGERDVVIPAQQRTDEVGAVARGLQVFKDTAFQLVQTQSEYRAVFDNAALGIYCLDPRGHLVSVNAALLRLTGYADLAAIRDSIEGRSRYPLYADPERRAELMAFGLANDGYDAESCTIRRQDGAIVLTMQTVRPLRDATGKSLGWVGTVEDVTERQRVADEERLRIRAAVESAGESMMIADADGTPLFVNRAFIEVLGYDLADLITAGGIGPLLRDAADLKRLAMAGVGDNRRIEVELRAKCGRAVPMSISVSAITGEHDTLVGTVIICTDLSDRHAAEAQMQHMAQHDALTGLPNWAAFRLHLDAALGAAKSSGRHLGLLCLGLDRFKDVNDTLGHAAGDRMLQDVAARLTSLLDGGETLARLGGDEFIILQPYGVQPQAAEQLATLVLEEFSRPFHIGDNDFQAGASIGVSTFPDDCNVAEDFLRFGHLALYAAKAAGRGIVRRFSFDMDRALQSRSTLERDLRRTISENALVVHYQPQCRLLTGEIIGAEALVRWMHPERGLVSPAEFIPIAEATGLIGQLGEWVLRTACFAATSWPKGVRVAVNISPAQFRTGNLVSQVRSILAASSLPPHRLELEITEGVMLQDTEATLTILHALRALGVRLAMDDFGTGYSSLSYLRRMPIDKIKIDQSFIRALGVEPAAAALVRSIIGIGRGLGIEANAEGVETEAQAALLREEGCYEVQGWHYGRPQPTEAFAGLLQSGLARAA